MKKNTLFYILYIFAFAVIAVNTSFSVVKSLTPDINNLPEGEFLTSSAYQKGNTKVDFYIVKNSFGTAIRGETVLDGIHKNIYWQTDIENVNVSWLDEYSIIINEIPLNILTDKFDSRRGTAIFSDGVLAEKITEND